MCQSGTRIFLVLSFLFFTVLPLRLHAQQNSVSKERAEEIAWQVATAEAIRKDPDFFVIAIATGLVVSDPQAGTSLPAALSLLRKYQERLRQDSEEQGQR